MIDKEFFMVRMEIYDLLRHFYLSPPTQKLLNSLKQLSSENEDINKYLNLLKCVSSSDLTELEAEFTRLFIGPGKIPAPPYESYYTSRKKLLMQESTIAVRRKYLKAGLIMKRLYSIPDDHLVSEFEFMYYLCNKSYEEFIGRKNEKSVNFLQMQEEFLEQHLSIWIPDFCESIINSTNNDFFKGMAFFTRDYINEDMKVVKEMSKLLEETEHIKIQSL